MVTYANSEGSGEIVWIRKFTIRICSKLMSSPIILSKQRMSGHFEKCVLFFSISTEYIIMNIV